MATKSMILTPVCSNPKTMENPSSNRVLGATPKFLRPFQLVEPYQSAGIHHHGLHAIRPNGMKTKRKPCAEAGIFPIKPTIMPNFPKKARTNNTVLGADSSNGTLRVKTPTMARKLSLTTKTPNRENVSNELKSNDLRARVFKSRIPVRVALMDPKVLEDLEKEEQELVARLAVVGDNADKIRKVVRAQGAVRRTVRRTVPPPPPPPAGTKVVLPVVEPKTKPVNILRMKEGPPLSNRPEPESSVARYLSPVARAAMKRRSLSLQSTVMLTSPEFQLNVESPTAVNTALLVNSPFGTATPPWDGEHLMDPHCEDSVVKLTNVPVDELLPKDQSGSPTAIYNHLRKQMSILDAPDGTALLRRRNKTTGELMDLSEIAMLSSFSVRVQAQLASLFY